MGRRNRNRATSPAPEDRSRPAARAGTQRPVRRRARLEEAPRAPWHPFPLVELSILAGLVFIGIGIATDPGEPRTTLLFGGIGLISLASLELAIREHLAGYRSHSALLAAAVAIGLVIPLYFTRLPQEALLGIAFVLGVVAFRALRSVFEKRAEGMSWRA